MIENYSLRVSKKLILTTILLLFLSLSWVSTVGAETEQTDPYLALEAFSNSIADIAETVGPAVVNIDTVRMVKTQFPSFEDPNIQEIFWT